MRFGIVRGGSDGHSGKNDGDDSERKPEVELAPELEPLGREHYAQIEKILGYTFKNSSWLERALTHRSLQLKGNKTDYERLEFLGDAVLDLAIAQLLLDKHQEAREGELSKMRAALVNTTSLATIARNLNLGPYIRLSRGELANGGADRPSILADVFEALMGAIYREAGYDQALACVERLFGETITNVEPRDPKTELQEALHAAGSDAPVYLLECVEGPEHAPTFVSVVQVDGQVVGRGRGATKKASQQAAAAEALALMRSGDEIDKAFLKEQEVVKG
jgi:ribonuclease-3